MKTNKHHQLCASLVGSLLFITDVSHLHGAVNTFTNTEGWGAAVTAAGGFSTTLFGFNFFLRNLARQLSQISLLVPGSSSYLKTDNFHNHRPRDEWRAEHTITPEHGQTIRWRFTRPIHAVGWERASDDDTHFYRIFDVNNVEIGRIDFRTPTQLGGPVFGGFISDVPIGFASSFSDNNDQLHSIDNLRFAFATLPRCAPPFSPRHVFRSIGT